jgi:predicted HicB family RNase H-like nuclease
MSPKTRKSHPPTFKPFKPEQRENKMKGLYVELEPELHGRIKTAAQRCDVSMKSFVLQAVEFALDNMETP